MNKRLDSAALDEIEARANKATGREWQVAQRGKRLYIDVAQNTSIASSEDIHSKEERVWAFADYEFIAKARTDVPALIAALRASQAREAAVRALAQKWRDEMVFNRADRTDCAVELEQLLDTEPGGETK